MFARRPWVLVPLVTVAFAVACGRGEDAPSESAAPRSPSGTPAGQQVDEGTAGHVTGRIVLEGEAPKAEVIRMAADPVCMREVKGTQYTQYFLVGDDGGLQNVFVYVKDGLGNYVFDTPNEAVLLDQQGCRYIPHVFGVRVGQPLEILNSDPTLHNVHAQPKVNKEFNTGQPIQGMKHTVAFTHPEVMIPFKCDVHGWMNAYAGVVDHPYFAVSDNNGRFQIRTLPPGSYTIEAWHEKLGTQTQNVTIGEGEEREITFTFNVTT
jgi:nitrous oxide reductase accessory protein NosL